MHKSSVYWVFVVVDRFMLGGIPIQEAHFEGAISSKSLVSEWSLPVRESILSVDRLNT